MNNQFELDPPLPERRVRDIQQLAQAALGSQTTMEYQGILFSINRRYVTADLAPLAFFHLVEQVETTAEDAVLQLYTRIYPLLSCKHQWTELRRKSDAHFRSLSTLNFKGFAGPQKCKRCTAFALGIVLPAIGRDAIWQF